MLTFGSAPAGVLCHDRQAAYAVIWDARDQVATVQPQGSDKLWLPGGGAHETEMPVATVLREVQEELGRSARVVSRIGGAVQFFHAANENRWYRMIATFFHLVLGEPTGPAELELIWVDPMQEERFYHSCHAWAVAQSLLAMEK